MQNLSAFVRVFPVLVLAPAYLPRAPLRPRFDPSVPTYMKNVLIGDDNRAKIADFGVSKYFTDDEIRTPKTARSLARWVDNLRIHDLSCVF